MAQKKVFFVETSNKNGSSVRVTVGFRKQGKDDCKRRRYCFERIYAPRSMAPHYVGLSVVRDGSHFIDLDPSLFCAALSAAVRFCQENYPPEEEPTFFETSSPLLQPREFNSQALLESFGDFEPLFPFDLNEQEELEEGFLRSSRLVKDAHGKITPMILEGSTVLNCRLPCSAEEAPWTSWVVGHASSDDKKNDWAKRLTLRSDIDTFLTKSAVRQDCDRLTKSAVRQDCDRRDCSPSRGRDRD